VLPLRGYGRALAALAIAGVLALEALLATAAIGYRTPFYTRGEPREALVVQTIVTSGEIVLPMRNGDELPSKPPLFHWLGAIASKVQGRLSEASIRFPSLVFSLVTVAATAAAAWAWWGAATAVLSSVILATSFQWLASSVVARVDMVLAGTISLALLLFARAIETGRRIPVVVYVLLVAATLTKGPVGLVLPCAIALVTLALRGELRFVGWRDLRLLTLATGAVALWYAAAWAVGGQAFLDKQILKENVFRVLDAESAGAGHVEAFWYYVPLLAAGLAPWSLFVPGLAVAAWARRSAKRNPVASPPPSPETDPPGEVGIALEGFATADSSAAPVRQAPTVEPLAPESFDPRFDPHVLFLLVWGGLTFVMFSLAGSKRAVYLLPAYPAYAMLVGYAWNRVFAHGSSGGAAIALMAGAVATAAVVALAGILEVAGAFGVPLAAWLKGLVSDADVNNVAPMLEAMARHRVVVLPCALVMIVCAWTMIGAARSGRWVRVVIATAAAVFALTAVTSTTLLPAVASERSARSFLVRVEQHVPATTPLSFYRAFDYGAVFYRRAAIPVRESLAGVPEIDGAWLLTWPAFLPDLTEEVRRLDTGGEAAGAYEVEEVIASEDHDPSDRTSLVLVRIKRRIGDERSDGN
jgi:4-amino-4-deoxy-L-arabinose transferase-like glycosyltransferase